MRFITSEGFYEFVKGPMVWIAFAVFIFGSIYRLYRILSGVKKEAVVLPYMSFKYSLRSIAHWVTPFGTVNWRRHPIMTTVTFLFHFCLIVTPIFLLAHNILWFRAWHIRWWTLPQGLADFMTLIVVLCCVFFLFRRLIAKEVRFVTYASDYVILAIVFLPFFTGFLSYHHLFLPYKALIVLHILFGEIMLMAIPFTRLAHMIFSGFTRAYTGSEFGMVRHARDW
jgi:nitrate reductase gamma subunit